MQDPRAGQPQPRQSFADYWNDAAEWITTASGVFYPDLIEPASGFYEPVLHKFTQVLRESESSPDLLRNIFRVPNPMRTQLLRVFRRYVSPTTPVEMLKTTGKVEATIRSFGHDFRTIGEVSAAFDSRPIPDETLSALLMEHRERGKKGYDLTDLFFEEFELLFPELTITM